MMRFRHWLASALIGLCAAIIPREAGAADPAPPDEPLAPSLEETVKAAFAGHPEAQVTLGLTYEERGSTTNALRWFRRAAEQGHAEAMFKVGWCHGAGAGTVRNYAEALRWYRLAAEKGFVPAFYNIGVCYEKGLGVSASQTTALQWYQRGAERGDDFAQKAAGVFLEQGKGGAKRDPVAAARLYLLAAAQGNREAAVLRDQLWKKLTPEQRAAAEQQVAAIRARQTDKPASTAKAGEEKPKPKSKDFLE